MSNTSARGSFPIGRVPFPVTAPFRMQPGLTRISDPLETLLRPDNPAALVNSRLATERAVRLKRLPLIATSKLDDRQLVSLSQALAQMRSALPEPLLKDIDDSAFDSDTTGIAGHTQVEAQAQMLRAAIQDDFVLMTAADAKAPGCQDLQSSLFK